MESVIIETKYGVVIELRRWRQDKNRWLDEFAMEWKQSPEGWISCGWWPILARELGRWTGSHDLHETVARIDRIGIWIS